MPPKNQSGGTKDNEYDQEVERHVKRFLLGYKRRFKACDQLAIERVEYALKRALNDQVPFSYLTLDGIDLHAENGASRLEPLMQALHETGYPYLTQLYFWNLNLRTDDIHAMATFLTAKACVNTLDFLNCLIQQRDYSLLGSILSRCHSLTSLSIAHQQIETSTLRLFLTELSMKENLKQLAIRRCRLGGDAGCLLRDYVCRVALHDLDLQGNLLGVIGFSEFAPAFRHCQTLSKISLRDNGIDHMDQGHERLAQAMACVSGELMANTTLEVLDLGGNSVGPQAGQALLDMHRDRKAAKLPGVRIPVGHRDLPSEMYKDLMKAGKKSGSKKKKASSKKKR